jgi:hypothetical protein
VGNLEKAVLVHLNYERYERLVVEVPNLASAVVAARQAIGEG